MNVCGSEWCVDGAWGGECPCQCECCVCVCMYVTGSENGVEKACSVGLVNESL